VIAAEHGRLVLREDGREICALTAAHPEELTPFLDGVRRALRRPDENRDRGEMPEDHGPLRRFQPPDGSD
jgi:hypothetical protein